MTTAGVLDMAAVTVQPAGPVSGAVRAPASKSVTNRLLVIAALADGDSVLRAPLDSDDSRAMAACLAALGADVTIDGADWRVSGTGGALVTPGARLDARLSGTTARFVTAIATLAADGAEVDGAPALRRRPIGPLVDALRTLGAKVDDHDGALPVRVAGGGIAGGPVDIDVDRSSQFASAVLLAAPYAATDVECRLRGRSATDYIALTVDLMVAAGARVERTDGGWRVHAGGTYRPRDVEVEYDASAAAHLHALAAATGGAVTVANAVPTRQPDGTAVDVFAAFGCAVDTGAAGVTIAGPDRLRPVDVSLAAMPDQVTTFAALAALAPATSVLRDVGVARLHETDRLAALAAELGRLGIVVEAAADRLTIHGGTPRGPAVLRTYDDHRLAMAFTALAAHVPGVTIADPGCVAKTYPAFWHDLSMLGCRWHAAGAGDGT
ncbi:MAG TPA: 3-phosphoshikimate 1-carboxyvinyltransferase [Euzebyales bacterium]